MKKFAKLLAGAALLMFGAIASAQTTTITASHLDLGPFPISTGVVTFTPVNTNGIAIAFSDGTGAQHGTTAFACQVIAGAITGALSETGTVSGSCQVPDATETIPANILYTVQVCDQSLGLRTSGQCYTLPLVVGISGTTWALDHYGPPAPTSNVATLQAAQGTTVPTSCVAPSVFTLVNSSGSFLGFYTCVGGSEVAINSGGVGATGATGATGPAGTAATVSVGSTTTLAAGSPATVTNSGTASAAILNFGIPQGAAGSGGGASSFSQLTGTATPSQLPAATSSAQGAVELPTGQSSNVLGSAAFTPSTAYDAFGAATAAITAAETYSANGSNISSGTVSTARLPGSGSTTVNGQTCTLGGTCSISGSTLTTLNGITVGPSVTSANIAAPIRPTTSLIADYNMIDCTATVGGSCPDSSGNGNNATVETSAINLTTNPWGAFFNSGSPYTGGVTPQYINMPTADNAANLIVINFQVYPGVLDSGTTNYQPQWSGKMTILGSQSNSGTDYAILGGGGNGYQGTEGWWAPDVIYGGGSSFKDQSLLPQGGYPMTMVFYSGAPNQFWINGVAQTMTNQSSSALATIPNFWSLGYTAGCCGLSGFYGTVGKVMFYNTSATGTALDGLVKQITSYVSSTVSSRPGYPIPVGSQSATANILWDGDSISAGYSAGGTTIQQYLALNNTYTVINSSLSSATAEDMAVFFQVRNQQYLGLGRTTYYLGNGVTPSKCVIYLGTNDMTSGSTAAVAWSNIMSMGQQCHQDGGQSIVMTMTSRTNYDTQKNSLNALIRQYWKSSGAFDMLADIAEVPVLGANGASTNTTYFVDGTHFKTAGQQQEAIPVSNAINYLDGYTESYPNIVSTGTTYAMTDADRYLQLTGSQTNVTLPPCTGLTGQKFYIFSTLGVTVSNSSDAASAIVGSTVIPAATTYVYQVNLYGGPTAGGCNYIISQ